MADRLIDDCFRPDQKSLSHDEAIALLEARIAPVAGIESVALFKAAGRVLAEPAVALSPVPAHTNAAVDGFAFAHADYAGAQDRILQVAAGRAAAGHPFSGVLAPRQALRIFTGAVVPEGADTVVMQEDTQQPGGDAGGVLIRGGLARGANVRKAGEDVKAGQRLLDAGDVIRPQDLAALASIGLGAVSCRKLLRVAIVSTGDEVVRAGSRSLSPGEVYDANAPMLAALASCAGAEVVDLGILPDRPDAVSSALEQAARRFDVVITSGGASKGDEDHMAAALAALGSRHFWQIQVKPGRPMMLGQIGSSVVVGLPGNPVAVFVCFLMYVWPMLRRFAGAAWPRPRRLMLPAAFEFPKRKVGRREFWRGMLEISAEGRPAGLQVRKYERDGSGLISSLREADCLIDIPEDVTEVRRGDLVAVVPFTEFGIGR
jgi:molybdopterin molybdotransferase